MARCPDCQTEQSADFGMTTCTKCSAVFMVGLDGEVASAEPLSPEEDMASFEETPVQEMQQESVEAAPEQELQQFNDPTEYEAPVEEELNEVASEESDDYSENFLEDLSASPQEKISPEDPLDIQKFDQSLSSQMDDGEYIYDVIITGMDSADLKKDVLFALSEKRFSLIMSGLQKEVQKGELVIRDLNPVRAMLIVLRLQALDVTVEWRQKHFTQGEAPQEGEAEA